MMMSSTTMSPRSPLRLPSIEEGPQTPSPTPLGPEILSPSPPSSGFSPTTVRNTYLNKMAPFDTPSPPARRCVLGQPRRHVHWAQPLSGGMTTLTRPPGRWSIMKVSTQEQSLWRPAKKTGITKRPAGRALFAPGTKWECAQDGAMPDGEEPDAFPSISTWRVGINAAGASIISGLWTLFAIPGNYPSPTSSPSTSPVSASPARVSPLGLGGFTTPPPKYILPVSGNASLAPSLADPFTGDHESPLHSNTSSPFEFIVGDKPTELHTSPTLSNASSPFDSEISDQPAEECASPLDSTASSPFEYVIGDQPAGNCASPLDSTSSSPFDSVIGDQPVEDWASPVGSAASSPFDSVIGDQPTEDCASPLYGKSKSSKMSFFDSPPPQAQMPNKPPTPEMVRRSRFFTQHFAKKDAKRVAAATLPTPQTSRPNSFSMSYRNFSQRRPAPVAESRDDEIDKLINKARHIAIESPRQKRVRDAEARAQLQAEEAKARAAAEAKERAAIEKREAEEAAEQARLEAEEAERIEAERKAARKHQIILPIPTNIASDLETHLVSVQDSNTLFNSIGSFDMKKVSYDRILADERGVNAWLDDETVNAWFFALVQAIYRTRNYTKTPKVVPPAVAYNTGWWAAVQRNKGVENISGWSRRQGIKGDKLLACEKIFFPINTGAHWTLLIISGTARTIEFLDSFGGKGERERQIAKKWLEMELGDKYVAREWEDMQRTRSQHQSNVSDCGMFCCFNGLASAKQISYKEVRAEKMREARHMMAGVLYNGGFTGEFEL